VQTVVWSCPERHISFKLFSRLFAKVCSQCSQPYVFSFKQQLKLLMQPRRPPVFIGSYSVAPCTQQYELLSFQLI